MRGSSTGFGYICSEGRGLLQGRGDQSVSPLPSQLATHPLALVIHSIGTVDTIIGTSVWGPAYNDAMGKLDRFQDGSGARPWVDPVTLPLPIHRRLGGWLLGSQERPFCQLCYALETAPVLEPADFPDWKARGYWLSTFCSSGLQDVRALEVLRMTNSRPAATSSTFLNRYLPRCLSYHAPHLPFFDTDKRPGLSHPCPHSRKVLLEPSPQSPSLPLPLCSPLPSVLSSSPLSHLRSPSLLPRPSLPSLA